MWIFTFQTSPPTSQACPYLHWKVQIHFFSFQQGFHPLKNNELDPNLYPYIAKACPCIETLKWNIMDPFRFNLLVKTLEEKPWKLACLPPCEERCAFTWAQMLRSSHSTGSARAGWTRHDRYQLLKRPKVSLSRFKPCLSLLPNH